MTFFNRTGGLAPYPPDPLLEFQFQTESSPFYIGSIRQINLHNLGKLR